MRVLLVAVLVLLGGLALPSARAGGAPFVADAEGDTKLYAAYEGSPAEVPFAGGDASSVDLLSLDVVEGDMSLDFVFALKTLKQTAAFSTYEAHFTWKKVEYVVAAYLSTVPGAGASSRASLYAVESYYQYRADLEHEVDWEAGVIRVTVEKPYILDAKEENVPGKDDVLTDVYAVSRLSLAVIRTGLFGEVTDRAPDGEETKAFTLQVGDFSSGHLKAEAEHRVRVSNGGSTTFVYRVALSNTGERPDEVEVAAINLPEEWNATVQSPVRLEGGQTKVVTVLASVPFAHKHGGFDSFNVSFASRFDPASRAEVRLGVLHTPVPQPAGHHSDLFLHVEKRSGSFNFGGDDATMNTDPTHDKDSPEAPAMGVEQGGALYWWIPLNPRLSMGLDFDLERLGALTAAIAGRTVGEGKVSAELLYGPANVGPWDDDGGMTTLAESDEQAVALDLQAPTAVSLVLTPLPEADYLAFDPESSLYLKVVLESEEQRNLCCLAQTSSALITKDFKLTLPLNEYHDKLTGVAEAAAEIDLVAEGAVEKLGRPGTTMAYVFTLKNGGSKPALLEVDLAGAGVDMGTLAPEGPFELGPGESAKLTLAVAIPPQASEGQEIEVLLFAHAQDDPGRMAIARTKTVVTLASDANADETDVLLAAQAADNDTPGLGALGVLAALGVALLALRRRR